MSDSIRQVKAIPSAQSEQCEDTVSRQRLLSDLKELVAAWKKYPAMAEQIKGVETAIGYVEAIPSTQPERKKGKWIGVHAYCDHLNEEAKVNGKTKRYLPSGMVIGVYCNKCWCRADKKSDFCPNCGSDNRGERTKEGKDAEV